MISLPNRPDVVVIGAGAAGIAASRVLADAGVPHIVLEARDRIGGRAHTAACGTPYTLDLGCEWLHSADRNVLAGLASAHGFDIDKSEPPWRRRHPQRGFGEAEQAAFEREQAAFYQRLEEAAKRPKDGPASELLDPGARWNGLTDAISTYYNGAPLSRVSVHDFDRYIDTEVNWRVVGGYGALIAALGATMPLRLGCAVRRVDTSGAALRIETNLGTIETRAAIVTVPTGVLAAGAIGFDAALDDHLDAASGLPLGLADKLFFTLAEPEAFEPDTRLIGAPDRVDSGSYTLRSGGRALVEGYFGGDYARHLERGGLAAFADAARREITQALGRDIGARLEPVVATGWALDPYALGSYSHALPGRADARKTLAMPFQDRLLFAGEATSPHFFSTAHGAFEEGARAAGDVARDLALRPAGRAAAAGARR
jgi:monoamine oxidase